MDISRQREAFFDERWSSATLESFYETSSLEKSRILFSWITKRYICISSSRFIFPFVFPLGIRARYPPRFHRFNSMWYRYASRIDRSWKTSSKQRRGRNRPRWVPALLAIIRNNTRDGLKTGELEFQWCLERYAISNARQLITNYVSNLHLEYR